jgi:hypothetical protein
MRSRLVSFRSRLGPSLGLSLARAADPLPAVGLACDASVRRPVGGPPALRSRRGRSRRVTFHPYKGEEAALGVTAWREEKSGSQRGGSDTAACATSADAFRIGSG